jgi:eukaryotic-like serine/threonine-protein kinase
VPDAVHRLTSALESRYRIERELGAGGMATVYLAHDVRHDRKVALKVLRPELSAILGAERFLAEIKTTANLQHPHILSLFDSGEVEGLVFYVMPYVEGESLRDRLTREKQLPVEEAVRIAREVADALAYAHGHGVIHRDIKPENILLHGGHAQVADFGIALAASRSEGSTRMTETGMSLGTPHYMAPEQAMGEREITPKADIYALGCVLYEMLAAEPPFVGATAQAIIARVMTEEPRSLTLQRKTVPPYVEAAVARALQKLPADRFASAAQFADALSQAGGAPAPSPTPVRRAGEPRRRWLALAPWGLAVLAAGIAAWGWLGRPRAAGAIWQYVTLGDSIRISATAPGLAFSPDGRSLVFRDDGPNGLLWLKRWDQLEPTALPGTEGSSTPVFSPDGKWLAFTSDGRLKKIPAGGGAAVVLADSTAPPSYGAAWLDDGSLIYVVDRLDLLRRVTAGGQGGEVVMADSSLRGFGLLNPTPLPRSRGVLFVACQSGCFNSTLRVLDLRAGTQKRLVDNALGAWYLPTGHLLYVRRDGAALAAPFDLDRLEVTGPAVPVLENVAISISGADVMLAWSPSGTLAYLRGVASSDVTEAVRVNREGNMATIDSAWSGSFTSLALADDGRRLAVSVGIGAAATGIWVKQMDRGPFTRLSFSGQDRRPAWSPDGRLVAFIRDAGNGGNVYARLADGSGADRLLARVDRPVQEVAWSGDGQWLVLRTDNGAAGAGDLVGVRLGRDTTPVALVATQYSEYHPAVSRDGRWLAYTSNESGALEVYVRPFPGTSDGRWQVSNGGGSQPRWAPDGRELFYLDAAGRIVAAQVRTVPGFAVGRLEPLFETSALLLDAFHQSYEVTPDGRSVIFLRPHTTGRAAATPRLVVAEHWLDELGDRLRQ